MAEKRESENEVSSSIGLFLRSNPIGIFICFTLIDAIGIWQVNFRKGNTSLNLEIFL